MSEAPLGLRPIPVEEMGGVGQGNLRLGETLVDLEGFAGGRLGSRISLCGGEKSPITQHIVGVRYPRVARGVVRVLFNRLLEVLDTLLQSFFSPSVPKVAALEVELVGFGVHRMGAGQAGLPLGSEPDPDLAGNRAGDFFL